jgi:hypothetical protein
MEALKEKMTNLYYSNLEVQAKKNKININIPYIVTNVVITDTENINLSETETNYSEDFVYKKPWNKLNSVHKKIKMTEFVNNLTIDDLEMKKHLKKQLVQMITEKKLTKKNDVEYDHINGRIISIPSLQYKNNNYNI